MSFTLVAHDYAQSHSPGYVEVDDNIWCRDEELAQALTNYSTTSETKNMITSSIDSNMTAYYKKSEVNELVDDMKFTFMNSKADVGHQHSITDVTDLQTALDGKAEVNHTHSASELAAHTHEMEDINNLSQTLEQLEVDLAKAFEESTYENTTKIEDKVLNGSVRTYDEAPLSSFTNDESFYIEDGVIYIPYNTGPCKLTFQYACRFGTNNTVYMPGGVVKNGSVYELATSAMASRIDTSNSDYLQLIYQGVNTLLKYTDIHVEPDEYAKHNLKSKSDIGHTHTTSDITDLTTTLDTKANTSHTHTSADITDLTTTTHTLLNADLIKCIDGSCKCTLKNLYVDLVNSNYTSTLWAHMLHQYTHNYHSITKLVPNELYLESRDSYDTSYKSAWYISAYASKANGCRRLCFCDNIPASDNMSYNVWIDHLSGYGSLNTTIKHLVYSEEELEVGDAVEMTGDIAVNTFTDSDINFAVNPEAINSDDVPPVVKKCTTKTPKYCGVIIEKYSVDDKIIHGEVMKTELTCKCKMYRIATHGDFILHVPDSSVYEVGDVVLSDLSKLTEMTVLNDSCKIGKVSKVLNDTTLAIFSM